MPVKVVCGQCQKTIRVADELLGRRLKCPGCGGMIETTAPEPPTLDVAPPPPEPPPPEPPAGRKKKRKLYHDEERESWLPQIVIFGLPLPALLGIGVGGIVLIIGLIWVISVGYQGAQQQAKEERARQGTPEERAAREAVDALVKQTEDETTSERARQLAAEMLFFLAPQSKAAVPTLLRSAQVEDAVYRKLAKEALAEVAPDAVSELAAGLKDVKASVRELAAESLAHAGAAGKEATPALQKALKDDSEPVRTAAAAALKHIEAGTKPGPDEPDEAAVVGHLTQLREAESTDARRAAVVALGQAGPRAKEAVPDLANLLKNDSPDGAELRWSAALALLRIDENLPEVLDQVKHRLTKSTPIDRRLGYFRDVGDLGPRGKELAATLEEIARTPGPQPGTNEIVTRRAARWALRRVEAKGER